MKIIDVTNEDGRMCAVLLNALAAANFSNVSGKDMEAFTAARKWVSALAVQMAEQLKSKEKTPASSPVGGIKVKSVGKLAATSTKKRK